jgi:excisionase family DNA binding protein
MSEATRKDVLTVGEAAEYLRLHEQTVYHLLRSGQLKGARIGRVWRIHRATLEAFLSVKHLPDSANATANGREQRPEPGT